MNKTSLTFLALILMPVVSFAQTQNAYELKIEQEISKAQQEILDKQDKAEHYVAVYANLERFNITNNRHNLTSEEKKLYTDEFTKAVNEVFVKISKA